MDNLKIIKDRGLLMRNIRIVVALCHIEVSKEIKICVF